MTIRRQDLARSFFVQLTVIIALAASIGLVMCDPTARDFLSAYYQEQVINSLEGARETTDSAWGRFQLISDLTIGLLPSAVVAGAIVIAARRRSQGTLEELPRAPLMFALLTAASASLPIMISPKQSAYYAAPSWPFYATALALACLPAAEALASGWSRAAGFLCWSRRLRGMAVASVVGVVLTSPCWVGSVFRDGELMDDVRRLGEIVGAHETLSIDRDVAAEWSLQAYLFRRQYISLAADSQPRTYRLELAELGHRPTSEYALEDSGLSLFRLYRRVDAAQREAGASPRAGWR